MSRAGEGAAQLMRALPIFLVVAGLSGCGDQSPSSATASTASSRSTSTSSTAIAHAQSDAEGGGQRTPHQLFWDSSACVLDDRLGLRQVELLWKMEHGAGIPGVGRVGTRAERHITVALRHAVVATASAGC